MKQLRMALDNPGSAKDKIKSAGAKAKAKASSAGAAAAKIVRQPLYLAGIILAGGVLAAYVAAWRSKKAAELGWDAKKLAWVQLGALLAGAFGLAYGIKTSPQLRRNAVPLAIGLGATFGPMTAEAFAAVSGMSIGGGSSSSSAALPASEASADASVSGMIGRYRRRSAGAVSGPESVVYDVTPTRIGDGRGMARVGGVFDTPSPFSRVSGVFAPGRPSPMTSRPMPALS